MTFISRKQVFLALLEHFSYPLFGFSPLPLLWLLVRACSSELTSDFSVSWRFSAETRAVRSAPAASKRKLPNPPFILDMYRITKTTNHSGREGQDDKKKTGCVRRAIYLSITRGFSDLAHLCKSMKKPSKQDYKIDHFFKSTQKTRSQKQKPRESLTGWKTTSTGSFLSTDAVERTREGQDSTILSSLTQSSGYWPRAAVAQPSSVTITY